MTDERLTVLMVDDAERRAVLTWDGDLRKAVPSAMERAYRMVPEVYEAIELARSRKVTRVGALAYACLRLAEQKEDVTRTVAEYVERAGVPIGGVFEEGGGD